MAPLATLSTAAASFVASHLLLSHPFRRPLVRAVGEGSFRLIYSVIALATLLWTVSSYRAVPATPPAFVPGDTAWAIASAAMWVASVLLIGSLRRNPAMPAPGALEASRRNPAGVYAITRHPMMWSFAIWALVHLAIWPTPENHILTTAILLLALLGSAGQDSKKARLHGAMSDGWRLWRSRTAYWPFGAQMARRLPWRAAIPSMAVLLAGTLLWLIATWAHTPLGARVAAGIWRWVV